MVKLPKHSNITHTHVSSVIILNSLSYIAKTRSFMNIMYTTKTKPESCNATEKHWVLHAGRTRKQVTLATLAVLSIIRLTVRKTENTEARR